MIKILLLIIYMSGGELVIEQKSFEKPEECAVAGGQRVKEVSSHPKFEEGLFAGCIRTRVKEA